MQQIIEKTVNRSAGIMAMQSDLMQPEAAASHAPVSAPGAAKAAAPEQKPALSGHNSGSGCEDEQRKPLPANLPTTAPALPKDATLATTDATTPSVKSAAASGSITVKALLLITKEAALEISNLEDDANVAELGVDSLISLIVAERIRTELNIKVGG